MAWRKNLGCWTPQELIRWRSEKFFNGGADEHRPCVLGKKNQAVIKPAHHLVQVFAEVAEDLSHAAKLFAEPRDLRAHLTQLVAAVRRFGGSHVELAGRIAVELLVDGLDGRQHEPADDAGEQGRQQHRGEREECRRP